MHKKSTDDLGKYLLEEVIRAYFTEDESRITAIRNSEDWFEKKSCVEFRC